jgi:AP-2 complex subunit alpha
MLGYEVDFGHMEVINLISTPKYTEKQVGYVGMALLLKNTDEMLTLVVNSIRNDLQNPNEAIQCLSLAGIANIGGSQMTETLFNDVAKLLVSPGCRTPVKKKVRVMRWGVEGMCVGVWGGDAT